jgi:hypothetical protein
LELQTARTREQLLTEQTNELKLYQQRLAVFGSVIESSDFGDLVPHSTVILIEQLQTKLRTMLGINFAKRGDISQEMTSLSSSLEELDQVVAQARGKLEKARVFEIKSNAILTNARLLIDDLSSQEKKTRLSDDAVLTIEKFKGALEQIASSNNLSLSQKVDRLEIAILAEQAMDYLQGCKEQLAEIDSLIHDIERVDNRAKVFSRVRLNDEIAEQIAELRKLSSSLGTAKIPFPTESNGKLKAAKLAMQPLQIVIDDAIELATNPLAKPQKVNIEELLQSLQLDLLRAANNPLSEQRILDRFVRPIELRALLNAIHPFGNNWLVQLAISPIAPNSESGMFCLVSSSDGASIAELKSTTPPLNIITIIGVIKEHAIRRAGPVRIVFDPCKVSRIEAMSAR